MPAYLTSICFIFDLLADSSREKHLRAARLEFLEAVKSLAQARIDQIKEGGKKSKLKRIEVK